MTISTLVRWVPPPVITALTAALMWLTSSPQGERWHVMAQLGLALLIAFMGLVLMVLAARTLHQAHTTLLPFNPSQASTLVTQGVFGYSRNPIYVGDGLLLLAWGIWLGNGVSLLWLLVFILYMTKVQIKTEEQALTKKFGQPYQQYRQKVRRWL
ncbi:MAG: isoprenylcysteine carboxylmethyltransferase family protein [Oceanisphaera sp.]|uniref:methyltransferase family protein n=1 Tax=Oceanisphaera sp. TaxID=1929979 RepID=UPI003C741EB1